jgi:hypothetical protein
MRWLTERSPDGPSWSSKVVTGNLSAIRTRGGAPLRRGWPQGCHQRVTSTSIAHQTAFITGLSHHSGPGSRPTIAPVPLLP